MAQRHVDLHHNVAHVRHAGEVAALASDKKTDRDRRRLEKEATKSQTDTRTRKPLRQEREAVQNPVKWQLGGNGDSFFISLGEAEQSATLSTIRSQDQGLNAVASYSKQLDVINAQLDQVQAKIATQIHKLAHPPTPSIWDQLKGMFIMIGATIGMALLTVATDGIAGALAPAIEGAADGAAVAADAAIDASADGIADAAAEGAASAGADATADETADAAVEAAQDSIKQAAEKAGEDAGEQAAKIAAKKGLNEAAQKAVKEGVEKAVKKAVQEGLEKAVKDAVINEVENATTEISETAFQSAIKQGVESAAKDSINTAVKDATKEAIDKAVEGGLKTTAKNFAKRGLTRAVAGKFTSGILMGSALGTVGAIPGGITMAQQVKQAAIQKNMTLVQDAMTKLNIQSQELDNQGNILSSKSTSADQTLIVNAQSAEQAAGQQFSQAFSDFVQCFTGYQIKG